MSGILEYLDCPHCGNEAWIDMDRWTEHMFCSHCGYTKQTFVTNLDEVAEGKMPQIETFLVDKPYGAYFVRYQDDTADAGALHDASSATALLPEIDKYREEITEAYITRYVDGTIVKTDLLGKDSSDVSA